MMALAWGLGCLVLGVFVLPHEQVPHRAVTSLRLLAGATLLLAAGAILGREFLA